MGTGTGGAQLGDLGMGVGGELGSCTPLPEMTASPEGLAICQ